MEMKFQNEKQTLLFNPIRAAGLSAVWLNRVAALWAIRQTLNPREHGQLKRLKESVGSETAKEVIEYVLKGWSSFVTRAEEDAGAIALPAKPNVGFLLKYHFIAVSMMLAEQQMIAKKEAREAQAAVEAAKVKAIQKKPMTIVELTQDQINAYLSADESYDAFFNAITAKYGEWRPAKYAEKGISCEVIVCQPNCELVLAL